MLVERKSRKLSVWRSPRLAAWGRQTSERACDEISRNEEKHVKLKSVEII